LSRHLRDVVGRAGCAGLAALVSRAVFARPAPGGRERWLRTNHRDEPVTLWQGPAVTIGTCAGIAVVPALSPGVRLGVVGTVAATGALGAYDDLVGAGSTKGLGGHLGALRRGQVTSGAVKIVGMGSVGLLAGRILRPRQPLWEQLAAGALVAGSANLLNLLDLRPGRATKALVLVGGPAMLGGGIGGSLVTAPVAAALSLLPEDLAEHSMMGDAGANALGAAAGCAGAAALRRGPLVFCLAMVVGLTLASERISFTRVIETTPALRALDALGRRPPS
jgi:UDP-N-acetylmuramyl pentapeptide phosphotransferase/UDP-N-acetylglucosamine-1-phosphate transferase